MSTGSRLFDAAGDLLDWGTWALPDGSQECTLSAWVYFDSFPAAVDARVISKADGTAASNHDWMIGYADVSGNKKARARFFRHSGTVVGATTLATGQWYHIAAVKDTTDNVYLYLDGVQDGSAGAWLESLAANTNAVYVGNQPTAATNAPRGKIADAAVWSVALTSTQVGQLADLTYRPSDFPTGLQGYLSGGDLTDSSGQGRDASNTGTDFNAADPGFGGLPKGRMMMLGIG